VNCFSKHLLLGGFCGLVLLANSANATAVGSAGCGKPLPENPMNTLEIDGQTRSFILVVPKDS